MEAEAPRRDRRQKALTAQTSTRRQKTLTSQTPTPTRIPRHRCGYPRVATGLLGHTGALELMAIWCWTLRKSRWEPTAFAGTAYAGQTKLSAGFHWGI